MLNSIANFQYNHPSFVFPNIVTDQLVMNATGLGHPLMKTDTAVCNDFSIGNPAKLHWLQVPICLVKALFCGQWD